MRRLNELGYKSRLLTIYHHCMFCLLHPHIDTLKRYALAQVAGRGDGDSDGEQQGVENVEGVELADTSSLGVMMVMLRCIRVA